MANTIFANEVLENTLTDKLITKLNANGFLTVDTSLTETDGMIKKINRYTANMNSVETVAEGDGNTVALEVSYTPETYTVTTKQAKFVYTDEQAMTDSFAIDAGIGYLATDMTNSYTEAAILEFGKSTNEVGYTTKVTFDEFVDALAAMNIESENEDGVFALINPAMKAAIRKEFKDDLKYSEGFTKTGSIGSVSGVPLFISKAIPTGVIYVATASAVKAFIKKSNEVEQDRVADTRTNSIFARMVNVVALVDESKCVVIAPFQTITISTETIAAGTNKAIAGTNTLGATVAVYKNGTKLANATVTDGTWAYTVATAAEGDSITAVATQVNYATTTSAAKVVTA